MNRLARLSTALACLVGLPGVAGATVPEGFEDTAVFHGLKQPTSLAFSPDGRVFVTEKRGRIQVFNGLDDDSPTQVADLSGVVMDYWDEGLLAIALDPAFPAAPDLFVVYTVDAPPGGTPPVWNDNCPTPPGPTTDGCVTRNRVARLSLDGDAIVSETVLVEDWCQQYPSHAIADLAFGPDGALWVSGGEGASFMVVDYGQGGGSEGSPTPRNPCGDPPAGVGGLLEPPDALGGALRAQNVDPGATPLGGKVLRVDPATGAAWPGNPLPGAADRVVAFGLRNPFRMAFRPGTAELWLVDVGWKTWEELNVIGSAGAPAENFGWPCYEGPGKQAAYKSANLARCNDLYADPAGVSPPYFAYRHDEAVAPGDTCPTGPGAVTVLAFVDGGSFPAEYQGGLLVGDYARHCMWFLPKGADGRPDPGHVRLFSEAVGAIVDLERGPNGDMYYVDIVAGQVRRIRYPVEPQPPQVVLTADATSGSVPLTVSFDASASTDPDGGPLSFAWDLDGDGALDDATGPTASWTCLAGGDVTVTVEATDEDGMSATATIVVSVANTPPEPEITSPGPGFDWAVGQEIAFAGRATDVEDGEVLARSLEWAIEILHCSHDAPDQCHAHFVQEVAGAAGGTFHAPDHEWPSYLVLRLTATDSGGLSASTEARLPARGTTLQFWSIPEGIRVAVNENVWQAPFEVTVIERSTIAMAAESPQALNGVEWVFSSWSDGGPPSHSVVAGEVQSPVVLVFERMPVCPDGVVERGEECDGGACCAEDCRFEPDGAACSVPAECIASGRCRSGRCEAAVGPCVAPDACHEDGVCDPGSGECLYPARRPGTPCDDHDRCTTGDQCDGAGRCGGTRHECPPPAACEQSVECDGRGGCTHLMAPGWCRIEGECVLAGTLSPADPCAACAPGDSTEAWSTVPGCDRGGGCAAPPVAPASSPGAAATMVLLLLALLRCVGLPRRARFVP